MTTRAEAIKAAAAAYAAALDRRDAQTPAEAAAAAWHPSHPLTLTQLRDLITAQRDQTTRGRTDAA